MADITWGSAYTYYSGTQAQRAKCCDIDTDKFVAVYLDADDSKWYARVGTVSGTVISWGTASELGAGSVGSGFMDLCKLDTNKFVVVYCGTSEHGKARVGTVSGSTINWGTEVSLYSDVTKRISCCVLTTTKFFVGSRVTKDSTYYGWGRIGTVSGTNISWGGAVAFTAGTIGSTVCARISDTKAILCYQIWSTRYAYGIVVDCSGADPSYGGALDISEDYTGIASLSIAVLSSSKLAFAWNNNVTFADQEGRIVVLEVSNSTLSKGTYVVFHDASNGTPYTSIVATNTTDFLLVYAKSDSNDGVSRYCTVSGTVITLGGAEKWDDPNIYSIVSLCLIDSYKVALVTRQSTATEVGVVGYRYSACSVTTNAAADITEGTATLNGTLDADGGEACDCGFEWGEASDALDNTTTTESKTTGQTFSQGITGLKAIITYYFRAFATNSLGTCYGSILSFTTLGEVYPSVATTRVTGLVHRWFPGNYTLEINLGSITTGFGLPSWTKTPEPSVPPGEPYTPPPIDAIILPPCTAGETKCIGVDLYSCVLGQWALLARNNVACGGTGEGCIEGTSKYVNGVWHLCINGVWVKQAGL